MASESPVEMVQCCSKHFHKECLNKAFTSKLLCPLCRTGIQLQAGIQDIDAWKKTQLKETRQKLLDSAKKIVGSVLHKLQDMNMGTELERKLQQRDTPSNLLDESPDL